MATKTQALAAARRRWGKAVQIAERPHAMKPAEKETLRAKRTATRLEIESIKAAITDPRKILAELAQAAQFVCDVNGDAPSIPQLAEVNRRAQENIETMDRLAELTKWERDTRGLGHSYRFEVVEVKDSPIGRYCEIKCQADSLAELVERIGVKAAIAK